jgi:hypothetical protein
MSSPTILNLDDYAETSRVVRLNGRDFVLKTLTVEQFLATIKREKAREKALEKAGGKLEAGQLFENTIEDLLELIEGITRDDVKALRIDQMAALVKFARGEDVAPPVEASAPR